MNELFTVDYALNYEGWTLDPTANPMYNVYLLDEYTIRVRRNDFFLVLYITNRCEELVFAGRIYTIREYVTKIKKNLRKWVCRNSSSNTPTPPSSQPLGITPEQVSIVCVATEPLARITFGYYYNEECILLNPSTIDTLVITINGGEIQIEGTADASTIGDHVFVLSFQGVTTGTIRQITLYITVEPNGDFIIQENDSYILLENGEFILQE